MQAFIAAENSFLHKCRDLPSISYKTHTLLSSKLQLRHKTEDCNLQIITLITSKPEQLFVYSLSSSVRQPISLCVPRKNNFSLYILQNSSTANKIRTVSVHSFHVSLFLRWLLTNLGLWELSLILIFLVKLKIQHIYLCLSLYRYMYQWM